VSEWSILQRLERWYFAESDGVWEHERVIQIETLDNPGWRVDIPLSDTSLQSRSFERVEINRTKDDWIHAWVQDDSWHGACGPLNLTEALALFLSWADA